MKKKIILTFLIFLWLLPGCEAIVNNKPVIIVLDSQSIIIANGVDTVDFSKIMVSTVQSETFTIKNIGKFKLILSSSPSVEITGTGATAFSVTLQPAATLSPNKSTEFTIEFLPTAEQIYSATVTIANNDSDENPFTFTITGKGYTNPNVPEINVKQGNTDIPCTTGVYDFGTLNVGISSPAIVFTIENIGIVDLILTGIPDLIQKNGGYNSVFAINQNKIISTLQPSVQTFFTIYYNPNSVGMHSTTITIPNNDPDENPYTFTLTGTGIFPVTAPEINVKQDTFNIPCTTGSFNFGSTYVGNPTIPFEFTIENLGNANLLLTGAPKIAISGSDAKMFAIDETATASTIAQGTSTTFTITFTPTSIGSKTATISIANNDSNENPYIFNILGYGVAGVGDEKIIFVLKRGASMNAHWSGGFPVYDRNGNVISYPTLW